jgi:hypothetical protein
MPVPSKLSRSLHDSLGEESAAAMVDWMSETEASHTRPEDGFDAYEARMMARVAAMEAAAAKPDASLAQIAR